MEAISTRYAKALLSLAQENNQIQEYLKQVKRLYEILLSNREFNSLLDSAFISKEEKLEMIDRVLKDEDLTYLTNFVKVIVTNNRSYKLIYCLKEFIKLANEDLNILLGTIYSSKELTKKEKLDIQLAFEKKLGQKVEFTIKQDPSLLGGIKVLIDGKIYDGSLQNKLAMLKKELINGGN